MKIEISGAETIEHEGKVVVLNGNPEDANSIQEPTKIVPVEHTLDAASAAFEHTFSQHSVTVLDAGARHVVITDVNPYRLALAETAGVTLAVNPEVTPLQEVQKKLRMQEGFDVGLEMSGNPAAFRDMLANMSHGAKIAMLGIPANEMAMDWHQVIFSMLTIKGIYGREMYETWYKMTVMLECGLDISPVNHASPFLSRLRAGFRSHANRELREGNTRLARRSRCRISFEIQTTGSPKNLVHSDPQNVRSVFNIQSRSCSENLPSQCGRRVRRLGTNPTLLFVVSSRAAHLRPHPLRDICLWIRYLFA